ncbi:hypothetical protein ACNPN6_15275 [Enterobacter quasiroggenkampii]|uniref:hypothetical protein n=1 Tax=Enterobacter quasiroggenkampii TaxID=2497436 RepID=UPI003AAE4C6A
MRPYPMIIMPLVLLILPSISTADMQTPSACSAIGNALQEPYPSYADSVSLAGRQASCVAIKENGQWICTVYEEESCNPSETENSKENHAQSPVSDSPEIFEIYDKTTREVTSCMAGNVPLPLKYTKFNSQADAYASKGSKFLADFGIKGLYVMLRVHAFMKDKEICHTGTVNLEVQKPQDFKHF